MPYLGKGGKEKLVTSFYMGMTFPSLKKNGHFSNQGKTAWRLKVPTVIMDYLRTGFFFRMDILCTYPKGHLNLIYLIRHNMGFCNNKSSSSLLP